MKDKQTIVITVGGLGPMAGVSLHAQIIAETNAAKDQDHPSILHFSHPSEIPDRTEFLLKKTKENPAIGLFNVIDSAVHAASKLGFERMVVGIACNTSHAPQIWNELVHLLNTAEHKNVQLIHMIEETVHYLKSLGLATGAKIGLFSTTGTRQERVYSAILEGKGYTILEVPESIQAELHDSIYHTQWGIKACSSPVTQKARDNFLKYSRILIDQGAEAIILGCTEIPLALPEKKIDGIPLVDPMVALARALVREVAPEKLRPLFQK